MFYIEQCADFKLQQAWKAHKRGDRLDGLAEASSRLLFFYAIECGLKYLLLRERKRTRCPPAGQGLFYEHDLTRILHALGATAAAVGQPPTHLRLVLKAGRKNYAPSLDVLFAWRYGVEIDAQNAQAIMIWLRRVDDFIAKRMRTLL